MKKKALIILCTFGIIYISVVFTYKIGEERKRIRCMDNIEILEKAKMRFGATYGAGLGSKISMKVLKSYIGEESEKLRCPCGGKYILNEVGEPIICSCHRQENM
ncbi:MAG: hypothetical protein KAI43_02755 [Candidatus Aureabacteria bacterium]|nr:hypothetical protein [Candidatus Auribacterota bacterium]